MAVTMSQAFFLALVFETLFYGVFILVFAVSIHLQWQRRTPTKNVGDVIVFLFSVTLFIFISLQWILLLLACYEIYMTVERGIETELAFTDWSDTGSVVLFSLYQIQVWVGDVILVYRLYYISRKNIRQIIVPCVTCIATMVCAGNLIHAIANEDIHNPASVARIRTWGIPTFMMTLTENTYCAAMIAFHIWKTHRDSRYPTRRSNLGAILRIFVESAALWIVLMFITFFLFLANTPIWLTILHMTNPVLGICFCTMTARLNLLTHDDLSLENTSSGPSGEAYPPIQFASPPLGDLNQTKGTVESIDRRHTVLLNPRNKMQDDSLDFMDFAHDTIPLDDLHHSFETKKGSLDRGHSVFVV